MTFYFFASVVQHGASLLLRFSVIGVEKNALKPAHSGAREATASGCCSAPAVMPALTEAGQRLLRSMCSDGRRSATSLRHGVARNCVKNRQELVASDSPVFLALQGCLAYTHFRRI